MEAGNDWDAEMMLDLYLHDYFMKNGMNETAALFRLATGISIVHPVVINTPQGFLHEWWSMFYDMFASRQQQQTYSVAETSAEGGQLENYTQNVGPILPQPMINQQWAGIAHISTDFDSSFRFHEANQLRHPDSLAASSSHPQRQINFSQNQIKGEHSQSTQGLSYLPKSQPNSLISSPPFSHNFFLLTASNEQAPNHRQQIQMMNCDSAVPAQGVSHLPQSPKPTSVPSNLLFYDPVADEEGGKLENHTHNFRPILPKPMLNQQRPGKAHIPGDFDSSFWFPEANQLRHPASPAASSSFPQQQINFTQHQAKREDSPGISLERSIPVKRPTSYEKQKGFLPVTGPDAAGLNESVNRVTLKLGPLDAPNNQQQFLMLNCQSAQGLSHLPNSPGSSASFNHNFSPPAAYNEQAPNYQQEFQILNFQSAHEALSHLHKSQPPISSPPFSNNFFPPAAKNEQAPNHQQQGVSSHLSQTPKRTSVPSNLLFFDPVADREYLLDLLDDDDDNVDNSSTSFRLLRSRSDPNKYKREGFTFEEVGCLYRSESEVLCCNFSSDGGFIASTGFDEKVVVWNTETLDSASSLDQSHSHLITDICYQPNSVIFATSSFDKTVQIWDSAKPGKSLFKLEGHAEKVLSLDFHPRKADLLCSCDSNNELRLWNVNQRSCVFVSKLQGATRRIRIQPRFGKLIAIASENVINMIDAETEKLLFCLTGHSKEVLSISWDPTGKYIASVSEDSARVWSMSGGECLHQLHSSTGNNFRCCTFHPAYLDLLVIGCYQSLGLWHPIENKIVSVEAHRGLISSLAYSPKSKKIASTSHDQYVKLWK